MQTNIFYLHSYGVSTFWPQTYNVALDRIPPYLAPYSLISVANKYVVYASVLWHRYDKNDVFYEFSKN